MTLNLISCVSMPQLDQDVLLQRVAQSWDAVQRIASFAELNVSCLCYEDRSFQLQVRSRSLDTI